MGKIDRKSNIRPTAPDTKTPSKELISAAKLNTNSSPNSQLPMLNQVQKTPTKTHLRSKSQFGNYEERKVEATLYSIKEQYPNTKSRDSCRNFYVPKANMKIDLDNDLNILNNDIEYNISQKHQFFQVTSLLNVNKNDMVKTQRKAENERLLMLQSCIPKAKWYNDLVKYVFDKYSSNEITFSCIYVLTFIN